LLNEAKIDIKAKNKLLKKKGGTLLKLPPLSTLIKEPEVGPWKFKCQYDVYDYKGQPITWENYHVDMVTLRVKRSIQ
jgi:hypothetical protein